MKYKIRIVLERVIESDEDLTIKRLKEISEETKPEVAVDMGVDESDIVSLTIKKVASNDGKD